MKKFAICRMLTDDSGQGLVEYALAGAMISTVVIGGLHMVGQKINSLLIAAGNALP
jgi:Flp pilus assembly pilin Flp